jgi:2,4-dienoyl-CoA reductase-like NADH-dependent reductase (Old Yellow Enzyme family)
MTRPADSRLFRPGRIGPLEVKNRIVMPSMTTRAADEAGFVTEDAIAYYRTRARGGTGLITVEMASPEKVGRHRRRELGIYDDRFLPGLRSLVTAIHAHGATAAIQLGHGGGHTRVDICGETPIAPSAIPHPVLEETFETIVPAAMSAARIEQTVRAFAAAAARAARAGFDAVEIHAAHGYLLSQFLCPFENRREDRYGGSFETAPASRSRCCAPCVPRCRSARWSSASTVMISSRAACPSRRPSRSRGGRRERGPTRSTSLVAITGPGHPPRS